MLGKTYRILGNDVSIEDKDLASITGYVEAKVGEYIEDKQELAETDASPYSKQQLKLQQWLASDESGSGRQEGWAKKIFYGTLYAYAYTEGSSSPNLYSPEQQTYEDSITWSGSGGRVY